MAFLLVQESCIDAIKPSTNVSTQAINSPVYGINAQDRSMLETKTILRHQEPSSIPETTVGCMICLPIAKVENRINAIADV